MLCNPDYIAALKSSWVAEERNFAVKSIRRYSKNVGIRFRVIDVKDCNSDLRVLPADLICYH